MAAPQPAPAVSLAAPRAVPQTAQAASPAAQALPARLVKPVGADPERWLPVEEGLVAVLPEGGIRRGTALTVRGHGSVTLATALAAEASRQGNWVASVGMADLGVSALAGRGADLQRWRLVELPSAARGRCVLGASTVADVLGAVVGGFDLVLLGPGILPGGATARRLAARMREHGTSLICVLGCDPSTEAAGLRPEVRLAIDQVLWTGIEAGHGRLLARRAEVTVGGRGAASRPRRMLLWLPSADGRVACVEGGGVVASGGVSAAGHGPRVARVDHDLAVASGDGLTGRQRRAG